jgi:hypothetical protein
MTIAHDLTLRKMLLYELPAHTRQAFADMLAQFTVASHRGAGTEDPAPHRQTHHHKVGT